MPLLGIPKQNKNFLKKFTKKNICVWVVWWEIDIYFFQTEARPHAVRVAIVITDGRSRHPSRTIREAMAAKKVGIMMITVGVGQAIFSEELSKIASSNQKMFNVADFSGLQDIVKTLKKLICRSKYIINNNNNDTKYNQA